MIGAFSGLPTRAARRLHGQDRNSHFSVVASDLAVATQAELPSKLGGGLDAPPDRPQSFIAVSQARTQSDFQAAAFLLESLYASRGYLVPSLDVDPESDFIFIAAENGAATATLTLRVDGPGGLRADESYGDELDVARSQGGRVCEFSRLAVAQNARSMPVIRALFGHAHELLRELRVLTDVFIEVNPRHVGFYRHAFGFRVAAGERMCPRVRAPSVLLRLELAAFEARLRESRERPSNLRKSHAFTHGPAPSASRSTSVGSRFTAIDPLIG